MNIQSKPSEQFVFVSPQGGAKFGKWEDPDEFSEKYNSADFKFAKDSILKRMEGSKNNRMMLLKLLRSIPTLKILPSEVQARVITAGDNLLCLGRSGTGKTTITILRLFAQELLYSALLKQHREIQALPEAERKNANPKISLAPGDVDKPTGQKVVFATASPVLTHEV